MWWLWHHRELDFWLFFDDTVRGVWCVFEEHTGRGWVLLFYFPCVLLGLLRGAWLLVCPPLTVTDRQLFSRGGGSCASSPRGLPACCALQKLQEEEEEEESNASKAPTTVSEEHL